MSGDSALFECVVGEVGRRLTTAKPNDMGGEVTSWSIDSSFLTSTDGFEFQFIGETVESKTGLELAPVELFVDGQSMLFGRIDVTVIGDVSPSVVTVRGRDYIADLVEGDIDPNAMSIVAGVTLEDAILQVCGTYGITHIEAGPEARQLARTKKQQKPTKRPRKKQLRDDKPEPGQCAYDFCNRILARHGLTMQPASAPHKVVLQAPNYSQDPIGRIVRKNTQFAAGNVIKGVATRDYSKCPTYAMFTGRQGAAAEKSSRTKNQWDIGEVADGYQGDLKDTLMQWALGGRRLPKNRAAIVPRALYRLLYWRDEKAKTQEQIDNSALRAVAERLKDTLRYEVTLRGLVNPDTGFYWANDTIVDVDDDVAMVHEKLWVASRRFTFDGTKLTTTLECWRPGTFQIGADQ
jgi:prophage tail gpP-like protein